MKPEHHIILHKGPKYQESKRAAMVSDEERAYNKIFTAKRRAAERRAAEKRMNDWWGAEA